MSTTDPFSPPTPSPAPAGTSNATRWVKSIAIAFVLFVGVAFAGCAGIALLANRGKNDAQAYLQRSLPSILTTWDDDELVRDMTKEAAADAAINHDKLRSFFTIGRERLGAFRAVDAAREWNSASNVDGSVVVRATVPVHFERGDAELHVILVKRDKVWRYNGFRVNSKAFNDLVGSPAERPAASH